MRRHRLLHTNGLRPGCGGARQTQRRVARTARGGNRSTACQSHELVIWLGGGYCVGGFRYLPQQDACMNGTVAPYSFSMSADGVNWGPTAATGTCASDTEENASTGQECNYTVDSPLSHRGHRDGRGIFFSPCVSCYDSRRVRSREGSSKKRQLEA
jgi:hypothetical protein